MCGKKKKQEEERMIEKTQLSEGVDKLKLKVPIID